LQYYVTRIRCNIILSSELEVPLESSVAQVVLFSIILRNVVEQRGMYQNNLNKITYL